MAAAFAVEPLVTAAAEVTVVATAEGEVREMGVARAVGQVATAGHAESVAARVTGSVGMSGVAIAGEVTVTVAVVAARVAWWL